MKKNIVLGITGGIAAYKSADLCSKLVQKGFEVQVIMTDNAQQFITPLTFRTLSKKAVLTSLWDNNSWAPTHVSLANWAEIFVVAPATANFLAKMATGIADDALSTFAVAYKGTSLIAPAMNPNMWSNVIVQENAKKLENLGVKFANPASGHVACGKDGVGRMVDVGEILKFIEEIANEL